MRHLEHDALPGPGEPQEGWSIRARIRPRRRAASRWDSQGDAATLRRSNLPYAGMRLLVTVALTPLCAGLASAPAYASTRSHVCFAERQAVVQWRREFSRLLMIQRVSRAEYNARYTPLSARTNEVFGTLSQAGTREQCQQIASEWCNTINAEYGGKCSYQP